jgi:hypothetical protein
MATKRKLAAMAPVDEDPVDPADELMFLCLGGGNEVGRSCHIIQYKGKTVMVRNSRFGYLGVEKLTCVARCGHASCLRGAVGHAFLRRIRLEHCRRTFDFPVSAWVPSLAPHRGGRVGASLAVGQISLLPVHENQWNTIYITPDRL